MEELNNLTKYQKDIERLIRRGDYLMLGLVNELQNELGNKNKQLLKDHIENISRYSFCENYNEWYNESLSVIKQLIPDRLDDFISYYKQPKRKVLTYETYAISDYLIHLTKPATLSTTGVSRTAVAAKFDQQLNIVKSLKERFNSSLYDIKQLLQADIFDSELESATELCKKGFYRAAGAVCGVVIEKNLQHVTVSNYLSLSKKHPVINDYNDLLKCNGVIDIATFRRIQLMGDIRNECDHNKDKEPKRESIEELIDLTNKLIKNVC